MNNIPLREVASIKIKDYMQLLLEKHKDKVIDYDLKSTIASEMFMFLEEMAIKDEIPAYIWITDNKVKVIGQESISILLPDLLLKWLLEEG